MLNSGLRKAKSQIEVLNGEKDKLIQKIEALHLELEEEKTARGRVIEENCDLKDQVDSLTQSNNTLQQSIRVLENDK